MPIAALGSQAGRKALADDGPEVSEEKQEGREHRAEPHKIASPLRGGKHGPRTACSSLEETSERHAAVAPPPAKLRLRAPQGLALRAGCTARPASGSSSVASFDASSGVSVGTSSPSIIAPPSGPRNSSSSVSTAASSGTGTMQSVAQLRGGGSGHSNPLEELLRRKGVDEAWNALSEMQRHGVTTDKLTVSRMLMKTVGDSRAHMNPARIYRSIAIVERFIDLQPLAVDDVLFNALLDTCCRLKDINRLEATIAKMRSLNVTPSPVTLGILVKTYGQAGDVQKVLQVWGAMEQQRKQANAVTFGCMMDACVKCGHLEKAVEIFNGMKRENKHRNTVLYTTLIKGFGLERDLKSALALFEEMEAEGVPCNTITYNSIIDACIKCGDVPLAEELLRKITDPTNPVEPDLITFSTLLKGYCNIGELDKALQVSEAIRNRGLRCDELVYNTLMDGCVKANDIAAGIGLFEEMLRSGTRPSSITHSILARLYHSAGCDQDMTEIVSQLYLYHGLERPSGKAFGRARKGSNSFAGTAKGAANAAPVEPWGAQSPASSSSRRSSYSGYQPWKETSPSWKDNSCISPSQWSAWGGESLAEHSSTSTPLGTPQMGLCSPTMEELQSFGFVPPLPFPGSECGMFDYNSGSMLHCSVPIGGCLSPASFGQHGFVGGLPTASPVFANHFANAPSNSSPVHATTPIDPSGGSAFGWRPAWASADGSSTFAEASLDTSSTVHSTEVKDSDGSKQQGSTMQGLSTNKRERYWDALESMCGIGSAQASCNTDSVAGWQGGAR